MATAIMTRSRPALLAICHASQLDMPDQVPRLCVSDLPQRSARKALETDTPESSVEFGLP